jgi:hypothetical protein
MIEWGSMTVGAITEHGMEDVAADRPINGRMAVAATACVMRCRRSVAGDTVGVTGVIEPDRLPGFRVMAVETASSVMPDRLGVARNTVERLVVREGNPIPIRAVVALSAIGGVMIGGSMVTAGAVVGIMVLHMIQPIVRAVAGAALLLAMLLRALVAGLAVRTGLMEVEDQLPGVSGMTQVAGT